MAGDGDLRKWHYFKLSLRFGSGCVICRAACTVAVAGVLYLFRNIYAEVGSALPLNGGAYNLLLNTTTKWRAALAACLTLLSYVATAVTSGSEAMHYTADLVPSINIFWATIGLLSVFAILSCWGITDSANVALMIFVFHIFTLIVLVGAVLTSYVGVVGLMRRMSLDMCLPQFLLTKNRWRGTNHWIIGLFLALCCSILLITSGKLEMLAGVYTLSFLSVMALFANGNLLLKRKHPQLKRTTTAKTPGVIVALAAVLLALVGNALIDPDYVRVFAIYFVAAVAIVGFIFYRTLLMTIVLQSLNTILTFGPFKRLKIRERIVKQLHELECRHLLFIIADSDSSELHKAAEYVRRNEQIRFMKIVWFYQTESEFPSDLEQIHTQLDHEFPTVHIDFVLVKSGINAASVRSIAKRLDVPGNYVFVTAKISTAIGGLGGAKIVV